MPPTINFPSSMDTSATLLNPFNIYKWRSALKVDIVEGDTIITLSDTIDIPSYVVNNFVGIDDEIMWVTAVDNSTADKKIIVERAQGNSLVSDHSLGSEVKQVYTAEYHNQLRIAIQAIEAQIGIGVAPISLIVNAEPYAYTFTGLKGYVYNLMVSVVDSTGNNKLTKMITVTHWNDTVHEPDTVDRLISSVGTDPIDIQITNKQIANSNFDIIITGCNGGTATITTQSLGATK